LTQSFSLMSASTDDDGAGPLISRDTTFDAFEMPCKLGKGDGVADHSEEEEEEDAQPGIGRSSTFDPFEADVQDATEPRNMALPSLLASILPTTCTRPGAEAPAESASAPALVPGSQAVLKGNPQGKPKDEAAQAVADISCTHLPSGTVRMHWAADSRRFAGRSATAVSPAFSVDLPSVGPLTFKIIIHAAATHGAKGSCNFQSSRGQAVIELKCESQLPSSASGRADETYRVHVDKVQGSRLGIDLESKNGEPWWIKTMGSGLISQWNHEHPAQRVNSGDSILEVNGVSGDLAKVRDACTKSGTLNIVLRRAGVTAPSFDVRFGIGGGGAVPAQRMRGPVRHDFAAESCCGLRAGDQVWDLMSAVDKNARKVRVVCELARVGPRSP